jgi:hypothetical protein
MNEAHNKILVSTSANFKPEASLFSNFYNGLAKDDKHYSYGQEIYIPPSHPNHFVNTNNFSPLYIAETAACYAWTFLNYYFDYILFNISSFYTYMFSPNHYDLLLRMKHDHYLMSVRLALKIPLLLKILLLQDLKLRDKHV